MPEEQAQTPEPSAHHDSAPTPALAEELGGSLRCAACRYELKGLTIQANCPECGLAIQATLLSLVDPRAAEIQPIGLPRAVAFGVNAWSLGALLAVAAGWAVWLSGIAGEVLTEAGQQKLMHAGAIALGISGLGAITYIRPHARIPVRNTIAAVLGILLYPLAIYFYLQLSAVAAAGPQSSMLGAMAGRPEPDHWRPERLAMWLTLAVGAWLLRPNLRILAARSLVLRANRVDRQTIAGSVAAVAIAALGDTLALAAPLFGNSGGAVLIIAEVLVGLGAVLLSLALIGIVIDTIRLTPAILQRPIAMADLLAAPSTGA